MNLRPLLSLFVAVVAFTSQGVMASDSPKTIINPSHLADTTQYGYSQAVVVASNAKTIHIAGQIGISEHGSNDYASQVDRAFANLLSVLREAGGQPEDVVKVTILIKNNDSNRLAYLVKKRLEVFGESPPASTLIPVTALALDSSEFEIDAVAVVAP